MNDSISRQEAVEAVYAVLQMSSSEHEWKRVRDALLDLSPTTDQQWIPCSERLPEENGQYLITVKYAHVDGYDDIYSEHREWADGKWDMFCFGHCGEVESILAWMPLPDPYKGEEV